MSHPEFPELGDTAYLEHAHRGPLPLRARRAIEGALALCARGVSAKPDLAAAATRARTNVAALLQVPSKDLHFTQNTTAALAAVAAGVDWRAGDRVVAIAADWPSSIEVWRRPGVTVDVLPVRSDDERVDHDALAAATRGARVLSIAAVCLATGERRDLERIAAIARREGALLVVDGSQAAGVVALDPRALGVDALAACSRKWLLGPPETGILYVREGAAIALPPRGALAEPLLAGLAASAGWLLEVGLRSIEEAALAHAQDLAARARHRGFEVRGDGPILRVLGARVADPGVIARDLGGAVRLSPHFWCSSKDIERAAASLVCS